MTKAWTLPADVIARARTVWDGRVPLSTVASGEGFTPVRVPVKGPTPVERGAQFEEVHLWLRAWRAAPAPMRVDWKTVNDRLVGRVESPVAAWLDTVEDVAQAVGKTKDLTRFAQQVAATPAVFRPFMARRPMRVLAIGADWPAVVSAATWLAENPESGLHARQIPASGVHTKIVETYRRDIAEMTPAVGDSAGASGKGWFASRYGLASKPLRIRLRILDDSLSGVPVFSDVEVPVEEAARFPVGASTVLIVENEITFLTLPPTPGTVAVYGNGRTASALVAAVPWLSARRLVYWGDIDTWGLVILNDVRGAAGCPVLSLLMDEATLLANRDAWVVEEKQVVTDVPHLDAVESALYRDLMSGRWGPSVRLEQERLAWHTVVESLTLFAKVCPAT